MGKILAGCLVVLLCLSCCTASAFSETFSIPISAGSVATFTNDSYIVADTIGTIYAFAPNGDLQWSAPGGPAIEGLFTVIPFPDNVYARFKGAGAGLLVCYDTKTGSIKFNVSMPQQSADFGEGALPANTEYFIHVFTTFVPSIGLGALAVSLKDGSIAYKERVKGGNFVSAFGLNDEVAVMYYYSNGPNVVTFNPANASDVFCNIPFGEHGAQGLLVAGNAGVISAPSNTSDPTATPDTALLYDFVGCHQLRNLTHDFGKWIIFKAFAHDLFLFHANITGNLSDPSAMRVNNWHLLKLDQQTGENIWRTELPVYGDNEGKAEPMLTRTAFQPDIMVVVSSGRFVAVNRTDGTIVWNVTTRIPYAEPAPTQYYGQVIYPLGNHQIFVPNLAGYTVYDIKTDSVVEATLYRPIAHTASFMTADGPVVVFIDLETSRVVGIKQN